MPPSSPRQRYASATSKTHTRSTNHRANNRQQHAKMDCAKGASCMDVVDACFSYRAEQTPTTALSRKHVVGPSRVQRVTDSEDGGYGSRKACGAGRPTEARTARQQERRRQHGSGRGRSVGRGGPRQDTGALALHSTIFFLLLGIRRAAVEMWWWWWSLPPPWCHSIIVTSNARPRRHPPADLRDSDTRYRFVGLTLQHRVRRSKASTNATAAEIDCVHMRWTAINETYSPACLLCRAGTHPR